MTTPNPAPQTWPEFIAGKSFRFRDAHYDGEAIWNAATAAAIERCAKACAGEMVPDDMGGRTADHNNALAHACAAIRALQEPQR